MERIVFAKWKIKESEASRILKMLPELAEKTRTEKGNISYTIYQSTILVNSSFTSIMSTPLPQKRIGKRNTTRESS